MAWNGRERRGRGRVGSRTSTAPSCLRSVDHSLSTCLLSAWCVRFLCLCWGDPHPRGASSSLVKGDVSSTVSAARAR